MSSVSREETTAPAIDRRQNAISLLLFLGAAFAFLLRSTISPQIVNMVVRYSSDGGSIPEKLHPGTYAVFLVLAAVLMTRPVMLKGEDFRLFKAVALYGALNCLVVFYLFMVGRAPSVGFIIDTYLTACAGAALMLCFSRAQRRALGNVILGMFILSALIGTTEAITHHRFLPFTEGELEFRPIGLSAHPLALGAFCATAIGFVSVARWPIWVRVLCIFILFIGAAASGARAALLLAACAVLLLLVFQPWPNLSASHQRKAKFVVLLFTLAAGSALVAVLFSAGLLNRFSNTIFDENYMARVTIYQIFNLVTWQDIMFGMNVSDLLEIVNKQLHLPFIESTPVVLTMLFGLPVALIFGGAFFWFFFRLMVNTPRAAVIGGMVFLLTALSNNALSSKAPDIMLISLLLLAYRNPDPGPKARASRPVRSTRLRGSALHEIAPAR